MPTLADVFREYGPEYLRRYDDTILPSHRKAIEDIIACRTAVRGGEVFWCDACEEYQYAYHACGNRHCPACGMDRADRWRDKQMETRLPVPYFLVTFTLPHALNEIAHSNQTLVYLSRFGGRLADPGAESGLARWADRPAALSVWTMGRSPFATSPARKPGPR